MRNYKRPWKGDEGREFRALVLHTYARNGLLSSREDRNVKKKGRHNPSKNSIINPYHAGCSKGISSLVERMAYPGCLLSPGLRRKTLRRIFSSMDFVLHFM